MESAIRLRPFISFAMQKLATKISLLRNGFLVRMVRALLYFTKKGHAST